MSDGTSGDAQTPWRQELDTVLNEQAAKDEAEAKYAQAVATLSQRMGANIPPDLPDSMVLLPLLMAMIAKQNAINLHHGRMLEKLDNLVQRVADLESGHVR